jgi:hypothetical protein
MSATVSTVLVSQAGAEGLESRVQIVALVVTVLLLLLVLELVRRRQLVERYALLWIIVACTLLVLAIWTDLLNSAADAFGIEVPANFLFLAALGVIFVLLLHFSVATSRLSEETKILAQEVARLDSELRAAHANGAAPNGDQDATSAAGPALAEREQLEASAAGGEQGAGEPPVEPQGRGQ